MPGPPAPTSSPSAPGGGNKAVPRIDSPNTTTSPLRLPSVSASQLATPPEGRVPPPGATRIRRMSPCNLQTRHPVIMTSCSHPIPSPSPFAPISIAHPPGSDGIPANAEEHRPCRSHSASSVSRREPVPFPHQVFRLIPREDANGTGVFHAEPPRAPRLIQVAPPTEGRVPPPGAAILRRVRSRGLQSGQALGAGIWPPRPA